MASMAYPMTDPLIAAAAEATMASFCSKSETRRQDNKITTATAAAAVAVAAVAAPAAE